MRAKQIAFTTAFVAVILSLCSCSRQPATDEDDRDEGMGRWHGGFYYPYGYYPWYYSGNRYYGPIVVTHPSPVVRSSGSSFNPGSIGSIGVPSGTVRGGFGGHGTSTAS